ncbi:molybdopterin cofactor-binding domain-containing protein [Novosphingobium sp.]|uniref:xanthine dehydrogenase family protein molybdopterin-binding subunit n=1 Tax=Novosphingobium sp. TaxID=1874826 RepID=UPI00333FB912
MKRRYFLIGGAAAVGAGVFGVWWGDSAATARAKRMTTGAGESSFAGWLKIGHDDTVTIYSPHIDFGQGSQTALAQMLADELDADWSKVRVEQAPADYAFANTALAKLFVPTMSGHPDAMKKLPDPVFSLLARNVPLQVTGGSSAIRATGQFGMRVVGAGARLALLAAAAERLGVPESELVAASGRVTHAKSGRSLRYGELAEAAASRPMVAEPVLKVPSAYTFIGKPVDRFDIPGKVNGSAQYGIDFVLPDMRVATVMAAPVRGGKLLSVDHAPAMAVKGVEKVIALDDAVVVVASGYWPALKGARALAPKFSDGGNGAVSTASIYDAQAKLMTEGKPTKSYGKGDLAAGFATPNAKPLSAEYRVPFLHQAAMEPFALTGHHKDGKLEVWGGMQDPLQTRTLLAKFSGLSVDDVTFHPMLIGGGFGRRFPPYSQIVEQIARVAMQVDHPVKLIWSREEDVKQGAYRPQSSARLKAALGADGKIAAWQTDYAQFADAETETVFPYTVPATARHHHQYISNQVDAYWRSVNSTQHGFYNESFVDELAHLAGADPYQFRRAHLPAGGRHRAVLDAVAKRSGWGTPLPAGTGRGIALVESFGSIAAHVVEASVRADGTPQVHKVYAVVDCGTTVNPKNAEAQVQGGILMGLSSAVGEAITLTGGAVDQHSFTDYPVLKLADAPQIDVHFIDSGATIGGLGEPGLPPAAPALANALFAATGKRIRHLPIAQQLA